MTSQSISYRSLIITYIGWWVAWLLFQAFLIRSLNHFSDEISFVDAAISNLILALTGLITVNTYRYYRPGSSESSYHLQRIVAMTFICTVASVGGLYFLYGSYQEYKDFLLSSVFLRLGFNWLMIAFMTVVTWLWFSTIEDQKNKKRNHDAEKLLKEAELSRLRQQLQPHFLFNSLNSISALAGSQPEAARKMIQQLSEFLRGTLKKDEQQLVSLGEELKQVILYLEIEKVRFGHRLNTKIIHDEKSIEMQLPALLLQPIVENAIKFGLYDTTGEIEISLEARAENNDLVIIIKNPCDPATSKTSSGTGYGLNSIQRRLYLIYARNDLLTAEQSGNLFITSLKIPQA